MQHELDRLPPWEALLKRVLWAQIGQLSDKRILDFGSGIGVTADHYAEGNEVVAVEPSQESVQQRWDHHPYCQIVGSTDALQQMPDESYDVIFCHSVLEYAPDREEILHQFHRLLKPQGSISLVKHNRPGRVMQMVVLLNEFEKASALLDGEDGCAAAYGTIRYYEDADITKWCAGLRIQETYGIRTFWDLQQNQECHKDPAWQEKMVAAELRVSQMPPYRDIAFFHHLILGKRTVRNAKFEDMKRLGHIMAASFRTAFSEFVSQQTMDACAQEDKCVALLEGIYREGKMHFLIGGNSGMLCWQETESGFEIVAIHSLPESWGTGLGHAMLAEALKQIGEKPVFLWAFKENRRARRFYEKHGFRWDGTERVSKFDGALEVRYVKR